jgi:hypothetical protein
MFFYLIVLKILKKISYIIIISKMANDRQQNFKLINKFYKKPSEQDILLLKQLFPNKIFFI